MHETRWNNIGSVVIGRKLDVLALSETKVKRTGECIFGRVSGVVNGRASEGVGLLLSKRVLEGVVEYRKMSARLMWVKVKFEGEFWVFVSACGPGSLEE